MIHKPGLSSQRVFWKCFPGVMKIQANPCRNLKTIPGKKICSESKRLIGGWGWVGLRNRKGLKQETEENLGFGSGGT